jgi:HEAT repeat protein
MSSGDEPALGGRGDDFTASAGLGGERAILHMAEMLNSDDPRAVTRAIKALRTLGSEQAEQLLIDYINRPSASRDSVFRAIRAIALFGGEATLQMLLALCHHQDSWLRMRAAPYLGQWANDPHAQETLYELMDDADPNVQAAALDPLAFSRGEAALQIVLNCARQPNPYIRGSAARALSYWADDPRVIEPLFVLLGDEAPAIKVGAAYSLSKVSAPKVAGRLIACMSSPHAPLRSGAATVLGKLRLTDAVPLLISALSDVDGDVRRSSVEALGTIGDRAALPHLIPLLEREQEHVRHAAAGALGKFDDPRAHEALMRCLDANGGPGDRLYVQSNMMALCASAGGIPYAIRALRQHPGSTVRTRAAIELGRRHRRHPDDRIVSALIAALGDPDEPVRRSAVQSLQDIATPGALAAVAAWQDSQRGREA